MKTKINIKDPRVLKRIKHAFGYAKACFDPVKPQCKSKIALNKHFGQAQNPVSQYLKHTLLQCVDHHFDKNTHISKKYVLKESGIATIRALLRGEIETAFPDYTYPMIERLKNDDKLFDSVCVNKFGEKEYIKELTALEFDYEDKSNRLWHPIQMLAKEYKQDLLATHGLKYHYDIVACAPTLLRQHAMKESSDGLFHKEIFDYIENRQEFRKLLAEECDVPEKIAKTTVNALFCGAKLGCNAQFALTKVLGYDPARIMLMRELTESLRGDIKDMWSCITPNMSRKRNTETGRLLAIQSKQKWGVYFELERKVLNSVRKYLKKTNNKHFLEHDGWATENMIDEGALLAFVYNETGFRINVDLEIFDSKYAADINDPSLCAASAESLIPSIAHAQQDINSQQSSPTKNITKHNNTYKCAAPVQFPMCITSPTKSIKSTWLTQYLEKDKECSDATRDE